MIKRLETIYVVSAPVPGTTGEAGAPGRKEKHRFHPMPFRTYDVTRSVLHTVGVEVNLSTVVQRCFVPGFAAAVQPSALQEVLSCCCSSPALRCIERG